MPRQSQSNTYSLQSVWLEWKTVIGLAFLGIGSGWLATILVHYLSKQIGLFVVLIFISVLSVTEDSNILQSNNGRLLS